MNSNHAFFALALLFAGAAIFCIWAGVSTAPDMTWPATPREWLATQLVALGTILKLIAFTFLASIDARR